MDQDTGLGFGGGPECQLHMGPVHRVACLKSHYPLPAMLDKQVAELPGSVTQQLVVVMLGQGNPFEGATHVDWPGFVQEIESAGMKDVGGAKHLFSFRLEIGLPDIGDGEDGKGETFLIAQEDPVTFLDSPGEFPGHIEGDGHGPQGAVRQVHILQDRFIVALAHESFEGRKAPGQQQLQVAELPVI